MKIEDDRYLKWADRLGILIWEDLPNVEILNDDARNRLEQIFKGNLMRDRNHPSVIVWCIANEAWGPDPSNPDHARWLNKMYAMGKSLSPDTLVIDNSPCYPNYHTSKTDIADFHFYTAIPAGYKRWIEFLDSLSSPKRRKKCFSPTHPMKISQLLFRSLARGDCQLFLSEEKFHGGFLRDGNPGCQQDSREDSRIRDSHRCGKI